MHKFLQVVILFLLSVLAIIFLGQLHSVVGWIADAHAYLSEQAIALLHGSSFARIIAEGLALFIAPFMVALIPAFIYWLIRRSFVSAYFTVVWIIWFMLITIMAHHA